MSEHDYSLLRPFDLEAAKRGEPIVGNDDGESRTFITGPDKHGYFVVESKQGYYRFGKPADYRMAPLCWVEGRPVYKGDVLYHHKLDRAGHYKFIADDFSDGKIGLKSVPDGFMVACPKNLTWTPPKVKRKVKLLAYLDADQLFWLREAAQPKWPATRVHIEDKVVEVEEYASQEGGDK